MTNKQAVVSDAYLLGINEGRNFLSTFGATEDEIKKHIENCNTLIGKNNSPAMAQTYRGERDFWKNQLKKSLSRRK